MKLCIFSDARSVHIRRIALGLASRGVDVHVCTRKPAEVPGATVEHFQVPGVGLSNPFRWRGRWERYLRDHMRRFDVVQVHFLADWGFTPELIDEGCFVATPWGSDIVCPPGEGPPDAGLIDARKLMLRRAAAVTAWGPRFAKQIGHYAAIDMRRIELLPLGVELDLFSPIRHRRDSLARRDGHIVGFYKGFRAVYGAIHLVHSIPGILAAFPETKFHFIGDGPELANCRQCADELGLGGCIRWTPCQPREMLPSIIQEWNVSVIPSLCESFGAAALESSAMEVPVVASNVGGLPDTVRDGETGLLVPPARPGALAEAVNSLLQNAPRRERMGKAGRDMVVREYNWNAILDHWVVTYQTALDRNCSAV